MLCDRVVDVHPFTPSSESCLAPSGRCKSKSCKTPSPAVSVDSCTLAFRCSDHSCEVWHPLNSDQCVPSLLPLASETCTIPHPPHVSDAVYPLWELHLWRKVVDALRPKVDAWDPAKGPPNAKDMYTVLLQRGEAFADGAQGLTKDLVRRVLIHLLRQLAEECDAASDVGDDAASDDSSSSSSSEGDPDEHVCEAPDSEEGSDPRPKKEIPARPEVSMVDFCPVRCSCTGSCPRGTKCKASYIIAFSATDIKEIFKGSLTLAIQKLPFPGGGLENVLLYQKTTSIAPGSLVGIVNISSSRQFTAATWPHAAHSFPPRDFRVNSTHGWAAAHNSC